MRNRLKDITLSVRGPRPKGWYVLTRCDAHAQPGRWEHCDWPSDWDPPPLALIELPIGELETAIEVARYCHQQFTRNECLDALASGRRGACAWEFKLVHEQSGDEIYGYALGLDILAAAHSNWTFDWNTNHMGDALRYARMVG